MSISDQISSKTPQTSRMVSRRTVLGRTVLGGALAGGMLTLPGCQSLGGFSLVDAIRRLLYLSSERAFARMLGADGFWDGAVSDVGLNSLLGSRGNVLGSILTSTLFKNRLEDAFSDVALKGAEKAAPIVTDAVRIIGIENAFALVNGGPSAATGFLRQSMGSSLVEAMVPELGTALQVAREPLVGQALAQLTGIDIAGVATNVAGKVDDTIWNEMGVEESGIRSNPSSTNDPLLIGVLTAGSRL